MAESCLNAAHIGSVVNAVQTPPFVGKKRSCQLANQRRAPNTPPSLRSISQDGPDSGGSQKTKACCVRLGSGDALSVRDDHAWDKAGD